MASEEDFAAYIEAVLPRLVQAGATGAMIWCYADYAPELYGRPPCVESIHERFSGWCTRTARSSRTRGVRRFRRQRAGRPPAIPTLPLDIPRRILRRPETHVRRLYDVYRRRRPPA